MNRRYFKRSMAALPLLVLVGAMYGCNTVEGMGEDISALGRGISDTSEKASGSSEPASEQTAEARRE